MPSPQKSSEHAPHLTRRDLLRLTTTASLGSALLASCDLFSTEPRRAGQHQPIPSTQNGNQPADLERAVKRGKLPPLGDRLPADPLILEVRQPGIYGGEWRRALVGQPTAWLDRSIAYDGLVRWHPTKNEVIPNVTTSVDADRDGTRYVFHLRSGMKWSDGHPFTAADIVFWYEAVVSNDELSPVKPDWMSPEETLGTVEARDDSTVVFHFASPNGIFLPRLASVLNAGPTSYPRHYLKTFHKNYNPEGIGDLVREHKTKDWVELFLGRADCWANRDLPTLYAWVLTSGLVSETGQVIAQRNPYYWKVDSDGRQLPYLDRIIHDVLTDNEVAVLKAQNGEYSLPIDINTPMNKPGFAEHRKQGHYHFVDETSDLMNEAIISLNQTSKDPTKRQIFRSKAFRIGLSHAINRIEISKTIYQRQGQPWQGAPKRERQEYYDEKMGTQYTEYDVAKANSSLDEAGHTRRDSSGFRLGPDDTRIAITVDVTADRKPEWVDLLGLVKRYWKAVGIDMRIKVESASLFIDRMNGNEPDAMIWHGDGGVAVFETPQYYFPSSVWCKYAPAWANWYNGDPQGEEPPTDVKEQMHLYHLGEQTTDPKRRARLMNRILSIAKDQFFNIGTIMIPEHYQIVRSDLHNVPDPVPYVDAFGSHARANPSQFFSKS